MKTPATIADFVDEIVKEKDFKDLDPEVREEVKKDLIDEAERRLSVAIVGWLPPDDLPAYGDVLDTDDEAKIQSFISERIPDLAERMAQELLAFRATYLG